MRNDDGARERLIELLREHSLVLGDVTLSSGKRTTYYIDARRTVMRPEGQRAAGELIARHASATGATAVGGPVMAAIPLACAAISVPEGRDLVGFFVRKERKEHGLQRWVEGGAQPGDRVLVVEDTVTTGGSTVSAIERVRDEGFEIAGVLSLVDRLAGGGDAIAAAAGAPYEALTTIDDIYPDRPDREG
jgi:orotate phosphoribosyltransferase